MAAAAHAAGNASITTVLGEYEAEACRRLCCTVHAATFTPAFMPFDDDVHARRLRPQTGSGRDEALTRGSAVFTADKRRRWHISSMREAVSQR